MKIKIWKLTENLPGHHSETLYKTEEEAFEAMLACHADHLGDRPYDEKVVFIESRRSHKVVWSDGEVWEWVICEEEFEIPDPKPEPCKVWVVEVKDGCTDAAIAAIHKDRNAAVDNMEARAKMYLDTLWDGGVDFTVDVTGDEVSVSIAGYLDTVISVREMKVD